MYNSVKSLGNNCFLLSVLVALLLPFGIVRGQGYDFNALKKEYPMLMERYGDRLESRNAHYIFAIDISSSMREYENVVRQSLVTFVNAVPEGDQITLIAMCDENNTNYINSIKCITINQTVRQSIVQTVESPQFKFLRERDANDGSDGFTMTRKVLDAMNVVNSSDMTFVYLLTDFEYWTHKNKYNKNNENWGELKVLLTDKHKGMMCKYGIELNCDKVSHPEAIFKPELDDIFGPLDYQQANSAVILAQWFEHIINDICAHKINAMLKADWKEYLDSVKVNLSIDGKTLNAEIHAPKCALVDSATVTLGENDSKYLTQHENVPVTTEDDNCWFASVGQYDSNRTWYPSILKEEAKDSRLMVSFNSPYADEIYKLRGICNEKAESLNAIKFDQEYSVQIPAVKVWNSDIPLWVCVLILALIVIWLISLLVTFLINKFGNIYRIWSIMATVNDGINSEDFSKRFPKTNKVLVTPSALNIVNEDSWQFEIITVDGPIYRFWRPRGYYIKRGNIGMSINRKGRKNVLPRSIYRVCPLKKWGQGCVLEFKVNGNDYTIKIM